MASTSPFDPFEALGVPRNASSTTIKAKFRQLARRYHPNRQQGPEESKAALSDAFHTIRHAYKQLIDDNKRRRYVELLALAEEQQQLLSRMSDLLREGEQESGHSEVKDGYLSSDADDEDLPQMGLVRRQTVLKRSSTIKRTQSNALEIVSPPRKGRPPRPSVREQTSSKSEADYFARRRKKLERLRRKELAAFETYKNAMVEKFEAEAEAESTREMYERAQWKREYFERAPRETTERLRSLQHYLGAIRAFGQLQPPRRNRSSVSYSEQILSTEDLVSSGYLNPNSATAHTSGRPSHSRAWSSDISNDQQTSSDEHSSGPGTPRPPTSFTWHRRHSRNTSLDDAFILPTISHSSELSRATIPEHAPFKMLVKQPTGFRDGIANDHEDDDDSSPESTSLTPRTPSPAELGCSNQYVMVRNQRLASALRPARARTPSPSGATRAGASRPNGMSNAPSHQAGEVDHFLIKRIGKLEHRNIPMDYVRELSLAEKTAMLLEPDTEADPADLLARLRVLDRNVATKFEIKTDILESFRFRLIHSQHANGRTNHDGFVALSYRRRRHAEKHQDHITLPLDDEMYQAVLEETGDLPLWLDQISIDGTSRLETAISMSAMDMVYRSARLVVVALDDVELEGHEGSVLENHMEEYAKMTHVAPNKRFRGKQPPYLDTRDELYGILRKILRSSWFKRAWCRHEMRLARDHIFLVPCKSPGSWTGRSVVRFTTTCFTHLLALAIEVPFEPDVEKIKPALYAFFRDRSKLESHERHLHSHHGNFTTVIAEVFGMEAGGDPRIPARQRAADALKDKVSIILNTMECGLAITQEMRDPRIHLTTAEAHYMLLTLALAAQDPGALCSVGPPMRLVQAETDSPLTPTATSTWLFEPTNVDAGLNNYHTLGRLPADACIYTGLEMGEHFVQLDLKFLNKKEARYVHRADEDLENLRFSRRFIEVCNARKLGRNRARYLMTDTSANRHFGNMAEVYEQTLACVFACGPDWVEDICQRYGVNRWKQDGEATWHLLVAIKNTAGEWPESAWGNQAAGFIMDFVNFLIIRGMPQRQILHREPWRPVWVATEEGGRIVTFVPPGEIMPAIPTALLNSDYIQLARLWVLQPRTLFGGSLSNGLSNWTLLGKSVIFSDDLAMQQLHSRNETFLEHQKVFGREDPEIQRLLRERNLYM